MIVRLRLQATLGQKYPGLAEPLDTEAATVGQLLDQQHIPRSEAAMLFLNDQRASLGSAIHDGDVIRVFPLLGGG
jgi:molybdopterin converting factor small subunit